MNEIIGLQFFCDGFDDDGNDAFDSPDTNDNWDALEKEAYRNLFKLDNYNPKRHPYTPNPRLSDSEVKRIRRNAYIWHRKNIKVGYSVDSLLEQNFKTVELLLHNQAFKNIHWVALKTIGPHSTQNVGSVEAIKIGDFTSFQASDKFPYDAHVTIYYREKQEIKVPFSSASLRGRNYTEVCKELLSIGFTNVTERLKKYMVGGLKKSNDAIKNVYINGKSSFNKGESYPYDVEIIVEYYSSVFSK